MKTEKDTIQSKFDDLAEAKTNLFRSVMDAVAFYSARVIITLIAVCIFLFIASLLTGCSSTEDPKPVFSIAGMYEGKNWYCSNPAACVIKEKDKAAVLRFSIKQEGETITATNGLWIKPSCVEVPSCNTSPWIADSIFYKNEEIFVKYRHGFIFKGTLQPNTSRFKGTVYNGDLLWNDDVEIIKLE